MMDALQWEVIHSYLKIILPILVKHSNLKRHIQGEEDEDEDHAANNSENFDDMDEYEERIERDNFDGDVDDHEVTLNFEEENMEYHDESDAEDDIGVQHVTNMTTVYTPPTSSFYATT